MKEKIADSAGPETETLVYKRVDGCELRLLTMKPDGWTAGDRRPAVLWIHGGGWTGGAPELFVPQCRYMAARGAVSFSVEYRLIDSGSGGPEAGRPSSAAGCLADCLADCADALRYIRDQAGMLGIDPSRIAVAGDSAGGHLAACLGTLVPSEEKGGYPVAAVVNCNGIADLTGKWRHAMQPPSEEAAATGEAAATEEDAVRIWFERREEARRLSPLFRVQGGQPPSLTLHGLLDRTVEPEQSVRYVEAHRACGNDARLVLLPRSKHAFILFGYTASREETMDALVRIDDFLTEFGLLASGT